MQKASRKKQRAPTIGLLFEARILSRPQALPCRAQALLWRPQALPWVNLMLQMLSSPLRPGGQRPYNGATPVGGGRWPLHPLIMKFPLPCLLM